MENQSAQQSFQPNEDGRSPEIQTGVAEPANGDDYWYPLLEKTRQEAFQRLERYQVSQQGHIQTYESDPLFQDLSARWQESRLPTPTEQEVRASLQDLQDLFPRMRACNINTFVAAVFVSFLFTITALCLTFLTGLNKSKSPWAKLIFAPGEAIGGEAGYALCLWLLVGRCISNTTFVQLKVDEGPLGLRDKYRLRGWVWRVVGFIHRGKLEGDKATPEQGNTRIQQILLGPHRILC